MTLFPAQIVFAPNAFIINGLTVIVTEFEF